MIDLIGHFLLGIHLCIGSCACIYACILGYKALFTGKTEGIDRLRP